MKISSHIVSFMDKARPGERLKALFTALARGVRRMEPVAVRARNRFSSCFSKQGGTALSRASLRLRLCAFFSLFLVLAWLAAAVLAWVECRDHMDEFFDTQQLLLAKRLASADLDSLASQLPATRDMLGPGKKASRGKEDDDALGFAVFTAQGQMILSDGENGKDFIFDPEARGFTRAMIRDSDDPWRIVWIPSLGGRHVVAVGQELEYRDDMALDMLAGQLLPWSLLLPVLLAGLAWMLTKELAPMHAVARQLERRSPGDGTPLREDGLPAEVRPLVSALNDLLDRMTALLARERAFISDAAHELRTPLAGLRVQAEVAMLTRDDETAQAHALEQLLNGIERSNRLVEQLLALSRLEALRDEMERGGKDSSPEYCSLQWTALLKENLNECRGFAERKNITLDVPAAWPDRRLYGHPVLMGLLFRNLLDNAVRYTPGGGWIRVILDERGLVIRNSGSGVEKAYESRLGERFFRPPGQEEAGSGLGLSMVKRIAELHGLRFFPRSRPEDAGDGAGFEARLVFPHGNGCS